jgi:hypothetical protein
MEGFADAAGANDVVQRMEDQKTRARFWSDMQRNNELQQNQQASLNLTGALRTGLHPETGEPLTPEEKQQFTQQLGLLDARNKDLFNNSIPVNAVGPNVGAALKTMPPETPSTTVSTGGITTPTGTVPGTPTTVTRPPVVKTQDQQLGDLRSMARTQATPLPPNEFVDLRRKMMLAGKSPQEINEAVNDLITRTTTYRGFAQMNKPVSLTLDDGTVVAGFADERNARYLDANQNEFPPGVHPMLTGTTTKATATPQSWIDKDGNSFTAIYNPTTKQFEDLATNKPIPAEKWQGAKMDLTQKMPFKKGWGRDENGKLYSYRLDANNQEVKDSRNFNDLPPGFAGAGMVTTTQHLTFDQDNNPVFYNTTSTRTPTGRGGGEGPAPTTAPGAGTPTGGAAAPSLPSGTLPVGFKKANPVYNKALNDYNEAFATDNFAQRALVSQNPVEQRSLAITLARTMGKRFSLAELSQFTTKMGVENSVEGFIKGLESGQMPTGVLQYLVQTAHDYMLTKKAELDVARGSPAPSAVPSPTGGTNAPPPPTGGAIVYPPGYTPKAKK